MGGGLYRALWVDLYGLSQPEAHDKRFRPLVRPSRCLQSAQRVTLAVEERANGTGWYRETIPLSLYSRSAGQPTTDPLPGVPLPTLEFPDPLQSSLQTSRNSKKPCLPASHSAARTAPSAKPRRDLASWQR